jgi:uncharacterized protein (UPF0332 family)
MSPRSEELIREADRRVREARIALEHGAVASAVSTSYYAMLDAARAALSELDRNARSHRGIWHLFYESYVATGRFDPSLHGAAVRQQRQREDVDYDAVSAGPEEATAAVTVAERFVAAVHDLLG